MASNETDLVNAVLPWILGIASIIASIWAGMRVLVCKGKTQANSENRIKLIEDRILEMLDEFDTFKKWAKGEHDEMNENVERKFSELKDEIMQIKASQAETNGYLKRLAEEKNYS
ncbi:MAG: hypothetical protein KGL95_00250 [Patescibacteria group bacterium]|nr:hypothetical protein [Patescibacteria group bacterium]